MGADLVAFINTILKLTETWSPREYSVVPLFDICLAIESRRLNQSAKVRGLNPLSCSAVERLV